MSQDARKRAGRRACGGGRRRGRRRRSINEMCMQIFGTDDTPTRTVFIEVFSELFDRFKKMKTFQNSNLSQKQRMEMLRETWDVLEDHKEALSTQAWMHACTFFHDCYKAMSAFSHFRF